MRLVYFSIYVQTPDIPIHEDLGGIPLGFPLSPACMYVALLLQRFRTIDPHAAALLFLSLAIRYTVRLRPL